MKFEKVFEKRKLWFMFALGILLVASFFFISKQKVVSVVGFAVYDEREVKGSELEGKIIDMSNLTTGWELNCVPFIYPPPLAEVPRYVQLVNCKNGKCDLVVYEGISPNVSKILNIEGGE